MSMNLIFTSINLILTAVNLTFTDVNFIFTPPHADFTPLYATYTTHLMVFTKRNAIDTNPISSPVNSVLPVSNQSDHCYISVSENKKNRNAFLFCPSRNNGIAVLLISKKNTSRRG
jgi:hypothetical protein